MTNLLSAFLSPDLVGVLHRHVTVAVAEISRGGCLLESSSAIPAGTVARLSVRIGDEVYIEDVRVARCLALAGAGERHHIGVEFLTLSRPTRQSLRRYAATLGNDSLRLIPAAR